MKLGLFYQSGYRIEACYYALEQFRKFYPTAPVALYEDNTDILLPVAQKFNCVYAKTTKNGFNDPNSGRPAFNIETTTAWLDRVYEACTTTLAEVDWIVHMEDDVWFLGKIEDIPPHDLSGIPGRGWQNKELYEYLGVHHCGAFGCGGSIFNRQKFIEAYHKVKDIDWEHIEKLAGEGSPTQWTDSMLTFVFLYSNFTVGSWRSTLTQYTHSNVPHKGNREGWPGTMEELAAEQGDSKVIHCWKPYYYPTEEETGYMYSQLNS
jgi:hypothetical protein